MWFWSYSVLFFSLKSVKKSHPKISDFFKQEKKIFKVMLVIFWCLLRFIERRSCSSLIEVIVSVLWLHSLFYPWHSVPAHTQASESSRQVAWNGGRRQLERRVWSHENTRCLPSADDWHSQKNGECIFLAVEGGGMRGGADIHLRDNDTQNCENTFGSSVCDSVIHHCQLSSPHRNFIAITVSRRNLQQMID